MLRLRISAYICQASNNPLTVAENYLQDNKTVIGIRYVSVMNNNGLVAYAPFSYTLYEIRKSYDACTVFVIDYSTGKIATNGRTKAGSWSGWKVFTGSNQ